VAPRSLERPTERGVLRRPRPRRAVALVVAAVAVVALEVVVVTGFAGSWIWVDRFLWHPLPAEVAVLALVVAAGWLGLRSSRHATAVTAVTVVIAMPVLLATWVLGSPGSPSVPLERFPAPGGRWAAVVDHSAVHLMNDGSHIWIESGQGPASRRWLAACLDAADPGDDVYAFTWENPYRARIETLRGDVHTLDLDPRTGQPLARIDIGPAATAICG